MNDNHEDENPKKNEDNEDASYIPLIKPTNMDFESRIFGENVLLSNERYLLREKVEYLTKEYVDLKQCNTFLLTLSACVFVLIPGVFDNFLSILQCLIVLMIALVDYIGIKTVFCTSMILILMIANFYGHEKTKVESKNIVNVPGS